MTKKMGPASLHRFTKDSLSGIDQNGISWFLLSTSLLIFVLESLFCEDPVSTDVAFVASSEM